MYFVHIEFCLPTQRTWNAEKHFSNSLNQHDTGLALRRATWKKYFHTPQRNVSGEKSDQIQSVTVIYKAFI